MIMGLSTGLTVEERHEMRRKYPTESGNYLLEKKKVTKEFATASGRATSSPRSHSRDKRVNERQSNRGECQRFWVLSHFHFKGRKGGLNRTQFALNPM